MLTRILTAAALLPVVLAVYLGPRWLFLLLAVAAGLLVTREALALCAARGMKPLDAAALAAVPIACLAFHSPGRLEPAASLVLVMALAFGLHFLLRPDVEGAVEALASTLAVVLVAALPIAFQVGLRALEPTAARPGLDAPALLVFLYAVVFGQDAAAYFAGRALGRTALAPRVSPRKTVEGFVGGVLGGVVLGCLFATLLPNGLSTKEAALCGFLLASAGAFGDLAVSLLKRGAGVKDSGTLLPGHGGLMDRLAGLTFAAPLLALLVRALPPLPAGSPP